MLNKVKQENMGDVFIYGRFLGKNLQIVPSGHTGKAQLIESAKVNGEPCSEIRVEGIQYTDPSGKEYSVDCTFIGPTTLELSLEENGECYDSLEIFSRVARYIGENWYRKATSFSLKKVSKQIVWMYPIPNTKKVLVSLSNWKKRPTFSWSFLSRSIKNQLIFFG